MKLTDPTPTPPRRLDPDSRAATGPAPPDPLLALIKTFEGYCSNAYQDSVGVWTLGYGCTSYADGRRVQRGDTCSKPQAEQWLRDHCDTLAEAIKALVTVPITDNQLNALISLTYNIGLKSLKRSTLLRKLNAGDYHGAAAEFERWTHAGNQTLPGLVRRRKAERALFERPKEDQRNA